MVYNRILLVDDDVDDLLIFKAALKEVAVAIECITAKNGLEALLHLKNAQPPPSLIFLDLNMPMMNGIECLEQIMQDDRLKEIPVVIFTTSNHPKDQKRTAELGAKKFLTKTPDFKTLKAELRLILGGSFDGPISAV